LATGVSLAITATSGVRKMGGELANYYQKSTKRQRDDSRDAKGLRGNQLHRELSKTLLQIKARNPGFRRARPMINGGIGGRRQRSSVTRKRSGHHWSGRFSAVPGHGADKRASLAAYHRCSGAFLLNAVADRIALLFVESFKRTFFAKPQLAQIVHGCLFAVVCDQGPFRRRFPARRKACTGMRPI